MPADTPDRPRILVVTALVAEHRALVETMTESATLKGVDHLVELSSGPADVDLLCLSNMGNVNSGVETAFYIAKHQPKFVVLCGIAGGVQSKGLALGDVLVADQVILYETSKIRRGRLGLKSNPERRFYSYPAGATILRAAKHLHVDLWPADVLRRLQREPGRTVPSVVVGPMASGEKVVADSKFLDPITRSFPLLKGIEMEGAGVMAAVHGAGNGCEGIVVKAVCDWADHHKNDDWHRVAAYASATFVKHLVDYLASMLDPSAAGSAAAEEVADSTTTGLFIEFLNPESQRIYGLDSVPDEVRTEQAHVAINAALFLQDRGVVFPIGTILETPYLMELLPALKPLVDAGFIRFSMRETSVQEFLAKRRGTYRDQEAEYPALFRDPTEGVLEAIPSHSIVSKETHVGQRIAQAFKLGPTALPEWQKVVAGLSPEQIGLVATIPQQLIDEDQAVTWTAFKNRLADRGLERLFELRKILQLTYCNMYVSEYRLEYLRNVDYAPFQLVPGSDIRRYDFAVLKRVLTAGGVWDRLIALKPLGMLWLLSRPSYRDFIGAYEELCRRPMTDRDTNALGEDLTRLAATGVGKAHRRRRPLKERLVHAMRDLRADLEQPYVGALKS
jgi:adenosylhomocysteine nucleosidase